ncbi:electron transfer DM13 [Herbihabitans rhizosphaerae]|uniref:Electron transfer DM13 n=1 Tax=Herbihabitans rhizosphaerae TaxID=1872711 RepID=A0A4Q7KCA5_9PSEU|nr:DM13 domain-containing protein [Herbihabitans rhizosphaerae]RZS29478.1 electron transfer DM13 [Herbihabitans rhizosphaerae]
MRGLLRKKVVWALLIVGAIGAAVGLWAFQPWKIWTRSTADDALPAEVAALDVTTTAAAPPPAGAPLPGPTSVPTTVSPPPSGPAVLAGGDFVSGEHDTKGRARVLRLSDGSRVLRLENFSTSDGPDVHVWLSDAASGGPWGAYDDGRYVRLGKMKATDGNQNYSIPADANIQGLRSVVIWCDRFNVAFGSAALPL